MQLTQKETELLKELKGQERLCIDKYNSYSQSARDPQLKSLFSQIAGVEQGHFDTLSQIENGQTPQTGSGGNQSGNQNSGGQSQQFSQTYGIGDDENKKNDCYLCTDALTTEKHASSLYDTCIFEFCDSNLRNTLNHIQSEEQNHGKMIYDYMNTNNMYS